MKPDWILIEETWIAATRHAIEETLAANPGETFYAGAFWLLYGDDVQINPPCLGLNSEESDPEIRWHPPDWRWDIVDSVIEHMESAYEPLGNLDVSESAWDALWERHIEVLSRVSKEVTRAARSGEIPKGDASLGPHFFVGIIDFAQGDDAIDYLHGSVAPDLLHASGVLEEH